MASDLKDNLLHGRDHPEDFASDNRWRHQESSAFARHAALSAAPKKVREADSHNDVSDLADFLNNSRVETPGAGTRVGTHKPILFDGRKEAGCQSAPNVAIGGNIDVVDIVRTDGREVRCGPLLNYRGMDGSTWFGSILIVTKGGIQDGNFAPVLKLRRAEDTSNDVNKSGNTSKSTGPSQTDNAASLGEEQSDPSNTKDIDNMKVEGTKLYADFRNVFWRFLLQVEIEEAEVQWEYEIPGLRFSLSTNKTDKQSFFVPGQNQSMKIMFHSCNGFSVGTDEAAWSGSALWNDVLRVHKERRLSVMIGGGDQIYNDGIRVHGPLRTWSAIPNPKKRRDFKFSEALRKDCDDWYAEHYIEHFTSEPFSRCNGQVPQLNMWDDHDIIDGYGSYVSDFMKCDVFCGIGDIAYKYYMLFQHHRAPPVSQNDVDASQIMEPGVNGVGVDSAYMKDTVAPRDQEEGGMWIIGSNPDPI